MSDGTGTFIPLTGVVVVLTILLWLDEIGRDSWMSVLTLDSCVYFLSLQIMAKLSRRDPDTPAHPAPNLEPALALKQDQAPHLQHMPGEVSWSWAAWPPQEPLRTPHQPCGRL